MLNRDLYYEEKNDLNIVYKFDSSATLRVTIRLSIISGKMWEWGRVN